MSLNAIYEISQIIAAIAIIASLIYGGLQFRAYAEAARHARVAASTNQLQMFNSQLSQNEDVARIYRDGLADFDKLESIDQWRFGALMQQLVHYFYLAYRFRDAMTPLALTHNAEWIFGRPGAREWWPKGRHMFDPELQSWMDERMAAPRRSAERSPVAE
jgi:hypothetical protein